MKPPLLVRELSDAERRALQGGLRSREAFTLRRAQILLASAEGQRPSGWAAGGSGPSSGSPAPTRHTRVKKSAGPTDPAGGGAPGVGAGLPGRDLVESARPAGHAC